ncbi:PTS sugar transporter subunit IIA [Sporolactobacillus sp. KGMB 08714]|uniref:PTS sugar transporter subunit IIA n=1 Tax=Sporolactobacillus sp. KGMB 08714 TaxID=3064704 RepID=UPI002FBD45BD
MLIDKNMVLTNVHADNEIDLITILAQRAFEMGYLSNVKEYISAVLKREKEFSTAFGYGVAIPHGETEVVKSSFLGFCKPFREVLWGTNKTPVSMVFMIGVPKKQKSTLHLKILADLSRHLLDPEFRDQISKSKTAADIYNLLISIEKGIKIP